MIFFNTYIGKMVQIELLGIGIKIGYLIDVGPDIIVIYMEKKYLYLPIAHIRNIALKPRQMSTESPPAPLSK